MEAHLVSEAHTNSRTFWRHFVEMVVAMLVSMVAFGALISMLFAVLGHSNLLHYRRCADCS